eukprot:9341237-Lingulodinium_polyedra.AAC.1
MSRKSCNARVEDEKSGQRGGGNLSLKYLANAWGGGKRVANATPGTPNANKMATKTTVANAATTTPDR